MSKRKVLLLSGLCLAAILVGVAIAIFINANAVRKVTGLDNPYVVFNFRPQRLEELGDFDRSKSMYRYDLSGGTVQDVLPHDGIYYSDLDSDTGMLIGRDCDQVVEISMAEGVKHLLGPGMYRGEPLVDSTIRWRPNSRDYSALTESGTLVLYQQEPGRFEVLADMSDVWNGYGFGCSWVDDGKTLCVPDASGIALLDVYSKTIEHWITLPITYSTESNMELYKNRSAFEVSNDKALIIYCEKYALKMATADVSGTLYETVTLAEHAPMDRTFAISPDGEAVIFAIKKQKRFLFTPGYYEVNIVQNGIISKLIEVSPLPQPGMRVLW